MLWPGYSFTDQAISELSGIGAPNRIMVVSALIVDAVLLIQRQSLFVKFASITLLFDRR